MLYQTVQSRSVENKVLTLQCQSDRGVVGAEVRLMLHSAEQLERPVLQCRGVHCDATADAIGAICVEHGHFRADSVQRAGLEQVGAILQEPADR